MRYLLLLSVFFFSCAPSAYKHLTVVQGDVSCIEKFKPNFSRTLYKADIDVVGNHLSGILFIKKMDDGSIRIVFNSQAGISFFDFEFDKNHQFKVHTIISKMNKKGVIKTLRKDFELILFDKIQLPYLVLKKDNDLYFSFADGKDRYYYITDDGCNQLVRMERGSTTKKVLHAVFENINKTDNIPEIINLRHTNFNFTIQLSKLSDNVDE